MEPLASPVARVMNSSEEIVAKLAIDRPAFGRGKNSEADLKLAASVTRGMKRISTLPECPTYSPSSSSSLNKLPKPAWNKSVLMLAPGSCALERRFESVHSIGKMPIVHRQIHMRVLIVLRTSRRVHCPSALRACDVSGSPRASCSIFISPSFTTVRILTGAAVPLRLVPLAANERMI